MIITRTPFRMSFFGGGTDLPEYFEEHGGAVLSTTFDKFCYLTVRKLPPFFDYNSEVVYSRIEQVKDISQIDHPAVRNAMKHMNLNHLRVAYDADLPARTGLGTSSSFAVGLLNAFFALKHESHTKKELAEQAIYLERNLCGEAGGWQDQIAVSYGGFNRIEFFGRDFNVVHLNIAKERKALLNDNLFLYFTDLKRNSYEIQRDCAKERERHLGEFKEMLRLVDVAQNILLDEKSDLNEFGRLLDETWNLKRKTGKDITTDEIDALYELGKSGGALGGKLLGAGGGGFLLFYVKKEDQEKFKRVMDEKLCIPFRFEEEGTKIIYNTENDIQNT